MIKILRHSVVAEVYLFSAVISNIIEKLCLYYQLQKFSAPLTFRETFLQLFDSIRNQDQILRYWYRYWTVMRKKTVDHICISNKLWSWAPTKGLKYEEKTKLIFLTCIWTKPCFHFRVWTIKLRSKKSLHPIVYMSSCSSSYIELNKENI
jgi:hypothetical protein